MMPLQRPSHRRRRLQKLALTRSGSRTARAFTLIELLLTVTLLLMLAGALVFSFSSLLSSNTSLEEGTARIETLIRLTRAHAANTGRTVQMVFASASGSASNSPPGNVRIRWEREPLSHPGVFEDIAEFSSQAEGLDDLVQIEEVRSLEPVFGAASNTMKDTFTIDAYNESDTAPPLTAITFYPDGSSDSVEILLSSRASEKKQRMSVRVSGIIGAVSRRLIESTDDSSGDDEPSEAIAAVAGK